MERRNNYYYTPAGTMFEIHRNRLYHPIKNVYSLPVMWEVIDGVDIAHINGQWVVDYGDWWIDNKIIN